MPLQLVLFAVSVVFVAVASAAQSAFGYLNATRLRRLLQQGASRSQAMFEVVHNPGPFLSSISLLYTLSVACATVITIDFMQTALTGVGARVLTALAAAILVLIAQAMGRRIATLWPERVASALYSPLRTIGVITLPIVWPGYVIADRMLRVFFKSKAEDRLATTEEDLRVLVDAVEETEALEEDEREMITSIFELSDRDVREIMVPRPDIVAVEVSFSVAATVDLLIATGHSRVPVFEGDLDHINGLVHLRELAEALRNERDESAVAGLVRAAHVVPETKKIDELLHDFQTQHIQMAIVADEYGGTAGLVTIEDLLEEIVGEIHDEYDVVEERIEVISEGEAIIDAGVSIHDVNETLNLDLDATEYETIGGLIYDRLGKVPTAGDVVETDHVTLRVLATKGRRIQRVQVTIQEP